MTSDDFERLQSDFDCFLWTQMISETISNDLDRFQQKQMNYKDLDDFQRCQLIQSISTAIANELKT